jgi:histidinol dehydrogenase
MSTPIRTLSTQAADFSVQLQQVLHWSAQTDAAIESQVAAIVDDVRKRGDAAVLEYTQRFDALHATEVAALEITQQELQAALQAITPAQRHALEAAAQRVRDYHERQLQACGLSWQYRDEDGTLLGQKVTPLDRVGIYVPGGKAAYPSSVLMNAVPAKVAGVGEIIMVVPTPQHTPHQQRNHLVLAAAAISGVDRVFTLGGAQAIAALAYGTATVPKVDKITGPGNAYVASAKRRVFGQVGIDMIAGPSEILILADGSTPPDWVAMDLFSQAEHDELAQSILLCPDLAYIAQVQAHIDRLLPSMPRRETIRASLVGRGALIHTRSMQEACEISNRIAPEHLEVSAADPHRYEPLLKHAGAIFLGAYTSESLGDYCAGPNHVLPTSGTARFSSPLGVYDFQKRSSLIEVSPQGAQKLGVIAAELAYGEGLQAHAQAAEMRLHSQLPPTLPSERGAVEEQNSTPSNTLNCIRPDVRAMSSYTVQPSAGMLKLDAMENPFMLPQPLREQLGQRLGQVALNRYPGQRIDALRSALAQSIHLPAGFEVLLGNGSDELISLLALACAQPGAKMLAPVPGFVMYEISAQLQGLAFVGVPLRPDFSLDAQAMLQAVRRHQPALIYLAYPNNPTANLFDDAVIEEIIQACTGLVVIDEAYQPFASRNFLARMVQYQHVLVMRTLSKFGLAGVRLGFLVGRSALIAQINKVRPPYNISVLNAEAALFALEHQSEFTAQASVLLRERGRLMQALEALPGVTPYASEANMILVRVPDAQAAFFALKQRHILVKNVSAQHPLLTNCLRITVGTPLENNQLIQALNESITA